MATGTLHEPYGVQDVDSLGPSQISSGRDGRRIDAARSSMTCDARAILPGLFY